MEQNKFKNTLPIGITLHDQYKIEKVLGQGGFGITYLASVLKLGQKVAIKEYLPVAWVMRDNTNTVTPKSSDKKTFEWGLNSFLDEAKTLIKFKHHNIVRILTYFETYGTAYIVMEYEEGDSLGEILKKEKEISEERIKEILFPLLNGIKELHREGIIHRDIKPDNIFIRKDGSPVLLDFGSARHVISCENNEQKDDNITTLVTPGYAPCEQYSSERKKQGPWSDIYAIGAVLYQIITREKPIRATSRKEDISNKEKDPLKLLSEIAKGKYSEKFLKAIDWALKVNSKDRPQNIDEWLKMLSESQKKTNTLIFGIAAGIIIVIICIITAVFLIKPKKNEEVIADKKNNKNSTPMTTNEITKQKEQTYKDTAVKSQDSKNTKMVNDDYLKQIQKQINISGQNNKLKNEPIEKETHDFKPKSEGSLKSFMNKYNKN